MGGAGGCGQEMSGAMAGEFGIVYPLWAEPQGWGDLLERAIGEVGCEHITVPVVTGPMVQLRLAAPEGPRLFHTEGGWHFAPAVERYRRGALRPRVARWLGKRNVLGRLSEYVAGRNVALILRVDVRAAAGLVEEGGGLLARNAWGDEEPSVGACVLNAELRELLYSTLDDLARFQPAGFQLVDWAPDIPAQRCPTRPLGWLPAARELLDLCFCPACRQCATLAGIDPDQAARSAAVHFAAVVAGPLDPQTGARCRADPVLAGYRRARQAASAEWLGRLAATRPGARHYLLTSADAERQSAAMSVPPTVLPVLRTDPVPGAAGEEDLIPAVRAAGGKCGLELPVWRPVFDQADRLVRAVRQSVAAGVTFFDFAGLDEAPVEAITWARQAVRFARRG